MKSKHATKRMFIKQEDDLILKFVEMYGVCDWNLIASMMLDRNAKQCRERYENYLSPSITNLPWTEEEDKQLRYLVNEYGNKFKTFTKYFPGRGLNNIKNRWYRYLSKRFNDVDTNIDFPEIYMNDFTFLESEMDSSLVTSDFYEFLKQEAI